MASTAQQQQQQQPSGGGGGGSASKPGMRKPVFGKVDQLKPGTNGHTLVVKVISSNTVPQKKGRNSQMISRGGGGASQSRIAECLIGDETGTILFTARNEQVCNSPSIYPHQSRQHPTCYAVYNLGEINVSRTHNQLTSSASPPMIPPLTLSLYFYDGLWGWEWWLCDYKLMGYEGGQWNDWQSCYSGGLHGWEVDLEWEGGGEEKSARGVWLKNWV
ncbi:nucleic acid-binding, OB-fold-like protein [Actinidia rufa]|uniref:Nucleic acid-binding, OB-fold-like protein n=1 Tax=Actinidia rufa TaxID=165716 RepID=A0A7J0E0T4_9ERIC|nr:nucleic acid-binding, OB-fold-like protein [Actinidia rufa]